MYAESYYIWHRRSNLNVLGSREWQGGRNDAGELILGKNRRFRLVARLMDKFARDTDTLRWGPTGHHRPERPADIQAGIFARGPIFQLLARLARRPLQKGPGFAHLRVVCEVRSMPTRRLEQLMQAAHRVLSPVNQSIFFGNLKRVASGSRHLVFTETSFRAHLCGLSSVQAQCKRSPRSLIAFWRRKRIIIGIKVQFVTNRAPTILSVLDSTTKWGYRDRAEFQ